MLVYIYTIETRPKLGVLAGKLGECCLIAN